MGALSLGAPFLHEEPGCGLASPTSRAVPQVQGISSFVTQSYANSGQAFPCGSGVNGRHILRDKGGDNEDYLHSIDIVARSRSAAENVAEGRGTAITAVADGRVVAVNMSQNECDRPFGAGNYVILEHEQILLDGKPLRSAYMHLNSTFAAEEASDCGINPSPTRSKSFQAPALGSVIRAGEKLGELGNTGNSTGPHLHFQFAHDCILQPASAVYCPAIAVLDINPTGFSDIRVSRDKSCGSETDLATGTPYSHPDERSYLSDGSYVTTSAPGEPAHSISASVGGP